MLVMKIILIILISAVLSIILLAFFMAVIKKAFTIIDEITPNIDELKEILRGNTAVSNYYSRILAAVITGISIIFSVVLVLSFMLVK